MMDLCFYFLYNGNDYILLEVIRIYKEGQKIRKVKNKYEKNYKENAGQKSSTSL